MPIVFIGAGVILILTGIKGDPVQLYNLVAADFTGTNNYLYWMVAILVLGVIGYNKTLEPASRAFMALVIVVLFLNNEGFFVKFQAQFFPSSSTSSIGSL